MLRASSQESKCPYCGSENLKPDFSIWDNATENLRKALEELKLKYTEYPGEAAFYGPKIDVHIKDALGRLWQLSTIQLDFFMPSNFDLYYIDKTVSVRNRKDRTKEYALDEFIGIMENEIREKKIDQDF